MRMQKNIGNALWTVLHAYALTYPQHPDDGAADNARFFLGVFNKLVEENSAHCGSCHNEWKEILRTMPPPLTGRTAFYNWTIAAHDRVNRKLQKPLHRPEISLNHALLRTP